MSTTSYLRWISALLLISEPLFAQFDASECGVKKGCAFVPPNCQQHNICREIFSHAPDSDGWVTMEVFNMASNPASNYIAVGFSKDDLMGDDSVTHCGFSEGNLGEIHQSFNDGKANIPIPDKEEGKDGQDVEIIEASREDGRMYCKFRQRVTSNGEHLPNLNETYNIMLVHGSTKDPKKMSIHSLSPDSDDFPTVLPRRLNVAMLTRETAQNESAVNKGSGASKTKRRFVLLHGMFMLVAWMFLVGTAIASARYLRNFMPEKSPFGLKIWFHIHRSLNALAILAMIIGVLFILIGKDWRWTGPMGGRSYAANSSPGAIHSIIGAIAVGIAILQPFNALLRCAPDARSRPIFNWFHRLSGVLGFICAIVAIIIAAFFFHVWNNRAWAVVLTFAYILLIIVFLIATECIALKLRQEPSAISFEMHNGRQLRGDGAHTVTTSKQEKRAQRTTSVIAFLFASVALAISVVMVILIALS